MTAINLATLQGYYYLYALYYDYLINNTWHAQKDEAQRVRALLARVRPLLGREQPYRKSLALRLFTERDVLARFPPPLMKEAWAALNDYVELRTGRSFATTLPRRVWRRTPYRPPAPLLKKERPPRPRPAAPRFFTPEA